MPENRRDEQESPDQTTRPDPAPARRGGGTPPAKVERAVKRPPQTREKE
ncbi:MAG: hypothetical protein HOW59_06070 [Nonomuraea sp.]|nr:hypothetical protein [Nonomuraea sp.]